MLSKINIYKKNSLVFFVILLVATFLRFYNLGSNPPSLTWDEAAWGYNAYSLGIDGRDEFGKFLPLDYLESFGDFKPPIYAYLDIIPIKIFGLNEFATRFPSALFGLLSIPATYFLVKRIFINSKSKEAYALSSAFFLAISPWHIMLSRAAFEANVAVFFIILAIWAFLAGLGEKKWLLLASSVSFVLSIYTFNTARVFVPIILLVLAFCFRKDLWKRKLHVLFAILTGILLLAPILSFLFSPQARLRFNEVNIFTDISIVKDANQQIENDKGAILSKVIHNRRVLFSLEYVRHYFDNLNPSFLFIKGDGNPKFSTQTVGQMYIWDIFFFTAGFFLIIRRREGYWWIIPIWLGVGIIPAAFARETPHALRVENSLPMFQVITAYGFVQVINLFDKYKYLWGGIFFILLLGNFFYFWYDYLNHYKYDYSGEWQYGYKESIEYVRSVESDYDLVQVTNSLGRPYIYYLFYNKISPSEFRRTSVVKRDSFGFVKVEKVGKYVFPQDFNHSLNNYGKVLYVNTPLNFPENISALKTFHLLNGQPVLTVYAYDKK